VSNEEPLINYNKNMMMMNEHYVATFEQKLVKKETTTQK
jgi:hypothetical protein